MLDRIIVRNGARATLWPDYRYQPLLAGHGDDGVVAVGAPRGWVNEDMDVLVDDRRGHGLLKHHVDVLRLEDLLKRVERKTGELGLDQVGSVLHDGLELHMAVRALPPAPEPDRYLWMAPWPNRKRGEAMPPPERYPRRTNKHKHKKNGPGDKVEHVNALGGLALGLAGGAGQLDAQKGEDGQAGQLVPHLHEPGVEVDLARERADGQEGGVAHDQERRDGLLRGRSRSWSSEDEGYFPEWASSHVKEAWVDVGSLLEDNDVSSCALGGGDLHKGGRTVSKEEEDWEERFWAAVHII